MLKVDSSERDQSEAVKPIDVTSSVRKSMDSSTTAVAAVIMSAKQMAAKLASVLRPVRLAFPILGRLEPQMTDAHRAEFKSADFVASA